MKKHNLASTLSINGILTIAFLIILIVSTNISAQTEKSGAIKDEQDNRTVELTPQKGKGEDKNIGEKKLDFGSRSIGRTVCNVEIKNFTKHFVYIYINDRPVGGMGNGNAFKTVSEIGRVKVYTRTDRQPVEYLYWGPTFFNCGSTQKDGFLAVDINPDKQ